MEIGLCLSFCNKRWKNPQALAEFVDSLGVRLVQFKSLVGRRNSG